MVDEMLAGEFVGGEDSGPTPSEDGHEVVSEVQQVGKGSVSEGETDIQGSYRSGTLPFHANDLRRQQRKESIREAWGELVRVLGIEGHPLRILDYTHLLHPYYEERFNTIPKGIWEQTQEEAKRMLEEDSKLHPRIQLHLRKIVNGLVPFGLNVEGED